MRLEVIWVHYTHLEVGAGEPTLDKNLFEVIDCVLFNEYYNGDDITLGLQPWDIIINNI